jgi:monoamine oxidase
VLESLDFEYSDDTKWLCILGGANQLALRMRDTLKKQPDYLSRVTKITSEGNMDMRVEFRKLVLDQKKDPQTRTYDGVFASTTLGCLKRIDTRKTTLNYYTKQAIRSLGYGPSAKVGIKFSRAWWIHDLGDQNIKKGGLGHSDLNIRTCVYPSYNIIDPKDDPAVLLCSYTWQQDAERIGALMSSDSDHDAQLKHEQELKELVLRDLARLHNYDGTTESEERLYNMISGYYLDHFAHDWTTDPNTAGAFAFFRPQQFTNMWNKMIHPSGDLIIIGEAASPHHAWVVGALESAVHGVHTWLAMHEYEIDGATEALSVLESTKDVNNPFVGLPPYMDRKLARLSAVVGKSAMEQHFKRIKKDGLVERKK